MSKLAIIIIAAGNSSRLGQPKQLVSKGHCSLLKYTAEIALQHTQSVTCVVGYDAKTISRELNGLSVECLINLNWQQGMGTSIACGIKNLTQDIDGVMILLCDQWALTSQDLEMLIQQWKQNPTEIVASQYPGKKSEADIIGVPAIFSKQFFNQLAQLKETGARKILMSNLDNVIPLKIQNAELDLDTPEDLA